MPFTADAEDVETPALPVLSADDRRALVGDVLPVLQRTATANVRRQLEQVQAQQEVFGKLLNWHLRRVAQQMSAVEECEDPKAARLMDRDVERKTATILALSSRGDDLAHNVLEMARALHIDIGLPNDDAPSAAQATVDGKSVPVTEGGFKRSRG